METTMGTQSKDVESIFDAVRKIKTEAERIDYLDQACGSDQGLRQRVEELLKYDSSASSILDTPPLGLAEPVDDQLFDGPGTLVGRYKLLERIGEGGFGDVYLAEQTESIHRKVALKIIKLGMDTRQVVARFEAERQALALMDHPNVAKVLDVGATVTGRPYFVMDLVKGLPITEYCDQNRLSTEDARASCRGTYRTRRNWRP